MAEQQEYRIDWSVRHISYASSKETPLCSVPSPTEEILFVISGSQLSYSRDLEKMVLLSRENYFEKSHCTSSLSVRTYWTRRRFPVCFPVPSDMKLGNLTDRIISTLWSARRSCWDLGGVRVAAHIRPSAALVFPSNPSLCRSAETFPRTFSDVWTWTYSLLTRAEFSCFVLCLLWKLLHWTRSDCQIHPLGQIFTPWDVMQYITSGYF